MEVNKVVLAEMFCNSSNGKTSIGKVMGTVICLVGLIGFLSGLIFFVGADLNVVLLSSSSLIFFGAALIMGKIIKPTTIGDITQSITTEQIIDENEKAH